ncbi:6-bladed beta-propeller [Belliella sp. DSM 111904]|uniref:6-bladed beta-propeller n=1 Tax=Belliella filtrata TaxID=2923435 RepID=A0ABS9UXF5_9BACT|nr:6-bladed beta-propeller [Belliella filtrata]
MLIEAEDIKALDEIIEDIIFLPFQIPDDSPIKKSSHNAMLLEDEHIYFSTGGHKDTPIHVFDTEGKYIQSFNKQGGGPEEYPFILRLDMFGDKLAIWNYKGVFKLYDKETFEYKGQKNLRI